MPHLTLETTPNLSPLPPVGGLFSELHRLLQEEAGISIDNCKSRHRMTGDFLVGGGGSDAAFAHLDLRFLEGRPPEILHRVGSGALEVLRGFLQDVPEGLDLQITVEVQEIRRASYFKHPPGTLSPPPLRQV
jgi:5-carboxymethyl-2-hydroxymuconate isomerase